MYALAQWGAYAADSEPGGILTAVGHFAPNGWQRNFNPLSKDVLPYTVDFIFEPLVIYDIMNGGRCVPRLAERLSYTADALGIVYFLRKDVQWSDGADFDASDVIYTFKLLKRHPSLDQYGLWDTVVKSVRKIDSHTVLFQLTHPNVAAEWLIAEQAIIPEHQFREVADPVTFRNPNPIGTGPFTQVRNFSSKSYMQCRNPYYWEENKPNIGCLRFPQYDSNKSAEADLVEGRIDWASIFVPDVRTAFVKKNPKHHHYWFPPDAEVSLFLNTTRRPFNDIAFRRALSMSLNREKIVENAMYNYAFISRCPIGIGEVYSRCYDSHVIERYAKYSAYAPSESDKLLDSAGYADASRDGYRQLPDGNTLHIEILVIKGWNDWEAAAGMIVEYMKEIGIRATVKSVPLKTWQRHMTSGVYDMAIGGGAVTPDPWGVYYYTLSSDLIGLKAEGRTWSRWSSPVSDALLAAYGKSDTPDCRRKILSRLQAVFAQNLPSIPLFSNPLWYEYNDSRFTGWANADNPYVRPSCYYHERLLHVLKLSLR